MTTTVFVADKYDSLKISDEFFAALAEALGAALEPSDYPQSGHAAMTMGRLRLSFRQGYGANSNRMTGRCYTKPSQAISGLRLPTFPSASFDPLRALDALVKDIRKRLVDPSAPILDAYAQAEAEAADLTARLTERAQALTTAFPGAVASVQQTNVTVRLRGPGGSISARMSSDGGLYIDTLQLKPELTHALLRLLARA